MRPPMITTVSGLLIKASKGLLRDFGEVSNLQNALDGPENFIELGLQRTEAMLHELLNKSYPKYNLSFVKSGFLNYGQEDDPTWIIDILNGYRNFCHGIPYFAMTAALKEKGQIIASVVYDPLRHDLFWACKGTGAFWDQTRLRVSGRKRLLQTMIALESRLPEKETEPSWGDMASQIGSIRFLGSPALSLAYLAAGRFDGFWSPQASLMDVAAAILLIKEAGGMITRPRSALLEPGNTPVVAGNEVVHKFINQSLYPLQPVSPR